MPKKRFSAEQIVTLLRQIEVSMAQGNFAIGVQMEVLCTKCTENLIQRQFQFWLVKFPALAPEFPAPPKL
jgi:hypothetical protein